MQTYQFRWDVVPGSFDFLMSGLQMTLIISAMTLVLAMVGGSAHRPARHVALLAAALDRHDVRRDHPQHADPGAAAVGLLRAADRVRRPDRPRSALSIGLSVYQAAFISEVYRAGIQAVPKGHREAAQVLGLTPVQTLPPHRAAAGDAT